MHYLIHPCRLASKSVYQVVLTLGFLFYSTLSLADLSTTAVFNGTGGSTIDGCGRVGSVTCNLSVIVPTGSTVEAAYLYTSTSFNNNIDLTPSIDFDGMMYSGADWTELGSANTVTNAFRADVTSQVAAAIGDGGVNPFEFTVFSEFPDFINPFIAAVDGEVLAIIYSNPAGPERTIAFLDGFVDTGGTSTEINLSQPLSGSDLADPAFEAILSLGIGFGIQGFDPLENTTVSVNGGNLTTCAGGYDDGLPSLGALITVGGTGDSTDGPNCDQDPSDQTKDDELYDFASLLSAGDNQALINVFYPGELDNIFFQAIDITARAGVNADAPDGPDPIPGVPEPSALLLLLTGLLSLRASSLRYGRVALPVSSRYPRAVLHQFPRY